MAYPTLRWGRFRIRLGEEPGEGTLFTAWTSYTQYMGPCQYLSLGLVMLLEILYNLKNEPDLTRCYLSAAKNPSSKSAATLASATARTRSVIEDLQARLSGDARSELPVRVPMVEIAKPKDLLPEQETEEDLERQLKAYFTRSSASGRSAVQSRGGPIVSNLSRTQMLDELQNRVVDGVVHRILSEWARREEELPGSSAMGNEIMERLIQRVYEQFQELALVS